MTVQQYSGMAVWQFDSAANSTAVQKHSSTHKEMNIWLRFFFLCLFFLCVWGGGGGGRGGAKGWNGRELSVVKANVADFRTESYGLFVSQILDTFLFLF